MSTVAVHTSRVIVTSVSRDHDHPLGGACEPTQHPGQPSDPGARAHDQISLRPMDMIEIRADQGIHVRLVISEVPSATSQTQNQ